MLRLLLLLAAVSQVFIFAASAHAGWVATEKNGSVRYIENGKMLFDEAEGQSSVFDAKNQRLTMFLPQVKAYAQGSPEELCQTLDAMTKAMRDAMGSGEVPKPQRPSVKINSVGNEKVAGFPARRYEVLVNGSPYENLWISTDPQLLEAFGPQDNKVLSAASLCLKNLDMDSEATPDLDPAYLDLINSGWVLREIFADEGREDENVDIVKLQKQSIPDTRFAPPAGYKKISFGEAFGGM